MSRGIGLDRRPLIIIDGRNFKREHEAPPAQSTQVAPGRIIDAKRMAFELVLTLGELIGVTLIMGSIVLLAVAMGGQ